MTAYTASLYSDVTSTTNIELVSNAEVSTTNCRLAEKEIKLERDRRSTEISSYSLIMPEAISNGFEERVIMFNISTRIGEIIAMSLAASIGALMSFLGLFAVLAHSLAWAIFGFGTGATFFAMLYKMLKHT